MSIRPSSVLAWALWVIFAVGMGAGITIDLTNGTSDYPPDLLVFLVSFSAFATIGLMVASRRPDNAIGWIFLSIGVLAGFASLSEAILRQVQELPDPIPTHMLIAAWFLSWFWIPQFSLATLFTLLLFPSGLPSRRWRPVLWISVLDVGVASGELALSPSLEIGTHTIPNPIGVTWMNAPLFDVFLFILGPTVVVAVTSIILRFRRSQGKERQQLKWFTFAALLLAVGFVVGAVYPPFEESLVGGAFFATSLVLLPLSVGIAILRYRLYAIDLIINRTLVYGTLTLLLAAVYFAGVALLQSSFRALTGQGSPLAVVLSTLAIAAAFNPLRRWIQTFIDRRFYRRKYDAQRALATFGTTARDEVELERLAQALVGTIDETMRPAQVSLWIREPE